MTRIKPPVSPLPREAPSAAANEKTCPRCGQPLSAEYTCGCPERWENEGGALWPVATGQSAQSLPPHKFAAVQIQGVAALMAKPHIDLIVVCDHGDMVGVLTKTDIVGQIGRCTGAGCTARVDSIMTRDVIYCRLPRRSLESVVVALASTDVRGRCCVPEVALS